MEHYLILLIHEESSWLGKGGPKLLAFDLQDHSIQEATLDESMFPVDIQDFTFTKYKDNQIIRFGGYMEKAKTYAPMVQITIKSLKRILCFPLTPEPSKFWSFLSEMWRNQY